MQKHSEYFHLFELDYFPPLELPVVVDAPDMDGVVPAFALRRHESRVFLWRYFGVVVDAAVLELYLEGLRRWVVADEGDVG